MASLQRKLETEQIRYTIAQLTEMRRKILRFARSLPPGLERNRHRNIAGKLRDLFRNKSWLDAHTVAGPTEYQVYSIGADGNGLKETDLDRPDDRAAVQAAKQFVDGHDIELWQGDRKITEFEHKD
jgi:hypothetical protein